jgi:DNA-binding transcriptional regulator YbjK
VSETSRRSELADAAIATLARDGSRCLTHRAVDRAAGVPQGSTSFYYRSRLDLLGATVRRLAELDATEIPSLPDTSGRDFAAAGL